MYGRLRYREERIISGLKKQGPTKGRVMGIGEFSARSCVVFTTPERFELFGSVLGEGVDARFDPEKTRPLDAFLETVAVSGGRTIVLDEAHFYTIEDLCGGLERYLDGKAAARHPMRFIVVCSRRMAADSALARLALYCGIYDLIYDAQGAQVSVELGRVLRRPNRRHDILEVFQHAAARLAREE